MPAKLVASSMALIAFAIAIMAGLSAGNPSAVVIWRALVSMIVVYFVGMLVGAIAERTLNEHLQEYRAMHPIDPRAIMTIDDATGEQRTAEADEADTPAIAATTPEPPGAAQRTAA